jgi:hypothetical protein
VTLEEAALLLRGSGLIVQVGARGELSAAADPEEPPDAVRAHSVASVYRFRFSMREIDGIWFLRDRPPRPAEQHPTLDDAVSRGLALFHEYRKRCSPRQYRDQFALFEASDPCAIVECAFVAAGWLGPQERLAELGLSYFADCSFKARFPELDRVVVLSVARLHDQLWRLVVRCYRDGSVSPRRAPFPVRSNNADGTPLADPHAASLSYTVACALHGPLAAVASNLRWAVHAEPEPGNEHAEPIAPLPA